MVMTLPGWCQHALARASRMGRTGSARAALQWLLQGAAVKHLGASDDFTWNKVVQLEKWEFKPGK